MLDDVFADDAASAGGAIENYSGTLTATADTFTGDTATDSGGGIYNARGTATLANDTFTGDSAGSYEGAIYSNAGSLSVVNDTISANSANYGGGVLLDNADPTVTNTILASNPGVTAWRSTIRPSPTGATTSTTTTFRTCLEGRPSVASAPAPTSRPIRCSVP